MRRIYSLLAGMLLVMSQFAYAQQKTITGKVTDAKDGSSLPGVTVKAKGTATGTVTIADGSFSINVPNSTNTLVFTFVGYGDQEVNVTNQSNVTVALSTGNKELSEVVVVGYGTQSKRELTGAVAKVQGKELENQPVASFESALQGRAPGVVIESGSGKVGQGIKIRIRGTSSISASSQPLYVIDGLPIISESQSVSTNDATNPLADINPNDIESVEVLKDASASAIYGARAANGVVLITTKKGRQGEKTVFEVNASTGFSKPTKKRGFLDAKQYVDLLMERAANDGRSQFATPLPDFPTFATEQESIDFFQKRITNRMNVLSLGTDWKNQAVNTNWEDQVYRDVAHTRQLDLSARGGTEKTKFYVSGFYNDQEAIVIVNRFRRYGARMNLEHQASNKLSFGINIAVNRSQLDRISDDNAFSTPGQLVAQAPVSPLTDPETGKLNSSTLYPNGLIDAAYNSNKQITFRTIGNAFATYNILPSLSFRTEFGADLSNLTEQQYLSKLSTDGAPKGTAYYNYTQNTNINTNNYFTFSPSLGENHNLSAVLGMSYQQNDLSTSYVEGENFPSDAIKNLSAAGSITAGTSYNQRYNFLSYFFRANYAFKGKYLAGFSIRSDGSSRFGPDNRYGYFPAGSLGWLISEEDFMKHNSVVSYLKLRASYGLTGNAEIGENQYQTLLEVTNYPNLPGYRPSQIGNTGLKWEKTAQMDAGLEFGLFNNRLSGEVDYYNKQTSDLLLQANVPYTSGFENIYRNVGKMENKGVEVMLNGTIIDGKDFRWTASVNVAYNKNKVKNIQGQILESSGAEQRAVEGQPIGVFFMPKYAGVDPATGDALFYDADGKTTNDYSKAERVVVGKSNPDWTGGFNTNFSYKGFDLSGFFTFVAGNKIYNRAGVYMSNSFAGGYDNQTVDQLRRWQKPGDITDVPRLSAFFTSGDNISSRWLYSGSYIRLKNVTLGYTVPKSVSNILHINSARIYVAGYNLWTKTKYISDPEVNTGVLGNIGGGVDFYTVPQARNFTVGLNVKL
ncbi:TonB-linked outer membrane protein, SusC/RagA family [Chitinophaga rupis]|uniref:TonB-linked outer membrane protein, SusC/RagA family n=1 Tax=Chitinophaga rupis TaxID=573321 RepID=A0A1H7KQD4_9BACT|nr:TonB-dependent receptor [Chitinophaga rupis]SEK88948.1 TonB-linked outer membrane protein, SusC/RagA family [Chitinophaga rupis]